MLRIFLSLALLLIPAFVPAQLPSRAANTTLNLPAELPLGAYELIETLPGSTFAVGPVHLTAPPGVTNELYAVEQNGLIRRISPWGAPPHASNVFLDITDRVRALHGEEGLLGLAFHPNYETNGWFFVFYTIEAPTPDHWQHDDVLARFTRNPNNPTIADPASEVVLFRQPNNMWGVNHNAGDLHFGPDGYLYLSLGDSGYNMESQIIDDGFFGGVLRIDVDERPENLLPNPHTNPLGPYRVPADNPYVDATHFNGLPINTATLRTEFYAAGLRNPWRMSVDPLTGEIILGDVGEGDWEEINYIVPGGNYGWPYREGPDPHIGTPPPGAAFIEPIYAYGRTDGLSVIGGFIYRGTALPELVGHYLYSDWGNGDIYALLPDGTNAVTPTALTSGESGFGPTSLAPDPINGDLLVTRNGWDRGVKRLVRSAGGTVPAIPERLSETGAFADLATLTPEAGIVPYDLNLPFWSDGALKSRWVSLPDTNQTFTSSLVGPWSAPSGTVWVKHFDLELTNGVPASTRRIETRFLVRTGTGAYGLSYRWNEDQTDADLVDEAGLSEPVTVLEAGVPIHFQWRYPGRAECLTCHTPQAGHALGFSTDQWNRDRAYGTVTTNQILAFAAMGYLDPPPGPAISWPRLAPADDDTVDLGFRVRSYLQANCVYCHGNGGVAQWDARWWPPLEDAGLIEAPVGRILDDPTARIVARGDLARSMLLNRINRRGAHQMPPLASERIDTQAVALVSAWITQLADHQTYDEWASIALAGQPPENMARTADPDEDGLTNEQEWRFQRNPLDSSDAFLLTAPAGSPGQLQFQQPAGVRVFIEATDSLFEPDWRIIDHPSNAWSLPAAPQLRTITDPPNSAARTYRLTEGRP